MALNNVGADSATYVTGLQVRTKFNTDLENLLTAFASASAPASPDAHMYWLDTSGGTYAVLKKRNPDNDAWIVFCNIHLTEDALYYPGGFKVLENSDVCTITLDGDDCYIKTSDGSIIFQTDEGTNTDTRVAVKGKGTGKGFLDVHDQSATNKVSVTVPNAIGADVTVQLPGFDCAFPTADGSANQVLQTDGAGTLSFGAAAGGGVLKNYLPNSAMTFWRSGLSAAPTYMTSTMSSVTGSSSADTTSIGYKATVQNTASSDGFLGWDLGSNGFVDGNVVDLTDLLGQLVNLFANVKASDASRVKMYIYDDVTGATTGTAHTGGGSFETINVSATIDSGATDVKFGLYITSGSQITVEVELFCLVMGSSCDHWLPYISRNRVFQVAGTYSSGANAITGCGFTPIGMTVDYAVVSGSTGAGSASISGATVTQKYRDSSAGPGSSYVAYMNGSHHGSWNFNNSDGGTLTVTGNNERAVITLFEGNPI
jgi:hypothetical protein